MANINEWVLPKLRVLHYLISRPNNGSFVAHCLDLDIVTSANEEDEAIRRLDSLVIAQIQFALNTGNFQNLIFPAPKEYWDRFMRAATTRIQTLKIEIPRPQVLPSEESESVLGIIAAGIAATVPQPAYAV